MSKYSEQRIKIDGYASDDCWLVFEPSDGWIVMADAICVAVGQATPDAAIAEAQRWLAEHSAEHAQTVADLRYRVGTR